VIFAGAVIRAPLTKVPENSLKFVVGIMLTSFGTFWAGEGFHVSWPLADVFILILAAIYLVASFLLVTALKQVKQRNLALAGASVTSNVTVEKHEEVHP
jgi:uncharacterized membrane protein